MTKIEMAGRIDVGLFSANRFSEVQAKCPDADGLA